MAVDIAPKSREELELEAAVFGDFEGLNSELAQLSKEGAFANNSDEEDLEDPGSEDDSGSDDELYFIDKGNNGSDNDEDSDSSMDADTPEEDEEEETVWQDSDDESHQVSLLASDRTKKLRKSTAENSIGHKEYENRLRSHFEKLYPRPAWASAKPPAIKADSDIESDEDDQTEYTASNPLKDTLARSTNYTSQTKSKLLPTSDLDIQRLTDVNKQLRSQAVIQSIEFHPTQPLVLTSGFDRTLRIYQIDGKTNPLATSLYIENCPFRTALFHPDGKRVIAAGRRRYMFFWDLESGSVEKVSRLYGHEHTQSSFENFLISPDGEYLALIGDNGWMNLLNGYTGQWVAGAKIDGTIAGIAWTEPETMTIINTNGEAWIWDVVSRQVRSRWRDSSLVDVTSIAQSTHWTAIGMGNGIVSIYDRRNPAKGMRLSSAEPESWEPSFVVENLVTTISSMKFSPDGQMLAISSKLKRDALRIVHVPSFSVFKNWPTSSTPLGNVTCVAWSPQNEMLAIGNEGGYARLWSLNHYSA